MVRLALDNISYKNDWLKAYELLRESGIAKKNIRSYALIGFNSGPLEAWERLEFIDKYCDVLPQWFHGLQQMQKNIVTPEQVKLGWTEQDRTRIMGYYYKRRGEPLISKA